jgi:SAM-dependent methyltransferase
MPGLNTSLHVDMLAFARRQPSFAKRLLRGLRRTRSRPLYGLEWGDPELVPPLAFIKERYVLPYVEARHRAVEIGPGGGRWTRYLLGFETLYAVDYHQELLDELKRNFGRRRNIRFIKNTGTDFPGIDEHSIDYLFSFGTFVHLDFDLIEAYLAAMRPILKPAANVVIQYSDKTKIMAQINEGFADNSPDRMRDAVRRAGYRILEEDTTSLWHSSVMRFTTA